MLKPIFLLSICVTTTFSSVVRNGSSCYVYPSPPDNSGQPADDAPSILEAFSECGTDGSVILTDNVFRINQVMNTTNLRNSEVSLYGEMVWSADVEYWRANSFPVVFQNQSTAWLFGGMNVTFRGFGRGRFDGQGQVWYDENMNTANQPGRPIAITFIDSTNLLIDGLTWSQPQFWHSFISHSDNVTMTNIFMNATSVNGNSTINTDGTNTWNANNIVLQNWTVQNGEIPLERNSADSWTLSSWSGDDCIAVKGNTTNLYVNNVTCYASSGMPIGSIGQYPETPDYVENVFFENIFLHDSVTAAWIKTWPGVSVGNTTNGDGGGGGTGYVKNVTFRNFRCDNVSQPIYVTQCTYNLNASICDTSELQLSGITWENFSGTSTYNVASSIHCSSSAPCDDLRFVDVNISSLSASSTEELYLCANIVNQNTTSGIPCNRRAPGDFPQHLYGNYQGTSVPMLTLPDGIAFAGSGNQQ